MKTVFPTSELVHIWAKQSQEAGKNQAGNVFFRDGKIYSYGHHFCMGNIIAPGVVLINQNTYSKTTAKQLHAVRYAVNHMQTILVNKPDGDLCDNLRGFISDIREQLDIIANDRKRQTTKDQAKGELTRIVERVEQYLQAIKADIKKRLPFKGQEETRKEFILYLEAAKSEQAAADMQTKLDKQAKKKAREEEQRRAQILADGKAELLNWSKNKGNQFHQYRHMDLPVMLRVSTEDFRVTTKVTKTKVIETSKGARVPYEQGRKLYTLIKAGRDVRGYDLNGYTVISLNGVLKVGCHEIDRKEIERFAKKEGW
jgi:hypothetical protein